jgi:3',5'-cyclic AMP phosphodiesterase CpdA
MSEPVRFVHLSDTHLVPRPGGEVRGVNTYRRLEALVRAVNALPFAPDFIVHTGDVLDDAEDEPDAACGLAAQVLARLRAPLHLVAGNHDGPELERYFPLPAGATDLGRGSERAYSFRVKEHAFAILDARMPGSQAALGRLPGAQLQGLERLLEGDFASVTVLVHYPPLGFDSPWIEERMRITNGEEIEARLRAAAARGRRIGGVFCGHVHRDFAAVAGGVLYSAVASPCFHFSGWPTDRDEPVIAPEPLIHFNVVSIGEQGTTVKGYAAEG